MIHLFYISIIIILISSIFVGIMYFKYIIKKTEKIFINLDKHLQSIIEEQEKLRNSFLELKINK